jgi:hypothetical protein
MKDKFGRSLVSSLITFALLLSVIHDFRIGLEVAGVIAQNCKRELHEAVDDLRLLREDLRWN